MHSSGPPTPRSASFDTDIGAFIECSAVGSPKGSMAQSVVRDHTRAEGFPAPDRLFVFGGVLLRADHTGRLDQIEGFAPMEGPAGSGASTPGPVDPKESNVT